MNIKYLDLNIESDFGLIVCNLMGVFNYHIRLIYIQVEDVMLLFCRCIYNFSVYTHVIYVFKLMRDTR